MNTQLVAHTMLFHITSVILWPIALFFFHVVLSIICSAVDCREMSFAFCCDFYIGVWRWIQRVLLHFLWLLTRIYLLQDSNQILN